MNKYKSGERLDKAFDAVNASLRAVQIEAQIELVESLLGWQDQETDLDGRAVAAAYYVFDGNALEILEHQVLPHLKQSLKRAMDVSNRYLNELRNNN